MLNGKYFLEWKKKLYAFFPSEMEMTQKKTESDKKKIDELVREKNVLSKVGVCVFGSESRNAWT